MSTTKWTWTRALLALAALLATVAWAPEQVQAQSDVQLWTSASLRYRATRTLRLEAGFLGRFDQDVSRGSLFGPQVGATLRLKKRLRVGAGYRYERRRIGGSLRNAHRLHFDLSLKRKFGRARLGYRLRFQERFRDRASGASDVRGALRNRLSLGIDTDSLFTPGVSVEFFTGLHGRHSGPLRKVRLTLSARFDVDPVVLEAYYRVQIPVDQPGDPTEHIIGLSVRFDVDGRRRRHRPASEHDTMSVTP